MYLARRGMHVVWSLQMQSPQSVVYGPRGRSMLGEQFEEGAGIFEIVHVSGEVRIVLPHLEHGGGVAQRRGFRHLPHRAGGYQVAKCDQAGDSSP